MNSVGEVEEDEHEQEARKEIFLQVVILDMSCKYDLHFAWYLVNRKKFGKQSL